MKKFTIEWVKAWVKREELELIKNDWKLKQGLLRPAPFGGRYPTRLAWWMEYRLGRRPLKSGWEFWYIGKPASAPEIRKVGADGAMRGEAIVVEFDRQNIVQVSTCTIPSYSLMKNPKARLPVTWRSELLSRVYHPWGPLGHDLTAGPSQTRRIWIGNGAIRVYTPYAKLSFQDHILPHRQWLLEQGLWQGTQETLAQRYKEIREKQRGKG